MSPDYDPAATAAYYDEYGGREWDRLERRPMDRVNLELHRRLLGRIVRAGDTVLEVGAGPGRFTIALAQLGARVAVVDISPRQLELNRERLVSGGLEESVIARELGDILDLSRFDDESFDIATAFGGPLSYVFDRAGDGLDQLLRKVKPGGTVSFSVMSRWGAVRMALAGILEYEREGLGELNSQAIETGDLVGKIAEVPGMSLPHECHLFTWDEVVHLLAGRACTLVDASASNYLSVNLGDLLEGLHGAEWDRLIEWEERISQAHGILDAGTHILVTVRRS